MNHATTPVYLFSTKEVGMVMPDTQRSSPTATAVAPAADLLNAVPALGIGIVYNTALADFVRTDPEAFDFLEITPDMFWTDYGRGAQPRYVELDSALEVLEWARPRYPIVAHNISLSIGSAGLFDEEYVAQIAAWHERYHFQWHSDHLSMVQYIDESGQVRDAALAVPFPYDHEVLEQIAERIGHVQRVVSAPFLVENNVYYIDFPEQEMTEPEFLNRLTAQTGCGLLLDVHNLYANARNHGYDPVADYLDLLDLSRVVEVHIAGGNELGEMYTDSHAGACPDPVWDLLEHVTPRTLNLRGVTFEFHDSYYPLLRADGIRGQLDRARAIWTRHR